MLRRCCCDRSGGALGTLNASFPFLTFLIPWGLRLITSAGWEW